MECSGMIKHAEGFSGIEAQRIQERHSQEFSKSHRVYLSDAFRWDSFFAFLTIRWVNYRQKHIFQRKIVQCYV